MVLFEWLQHILHVPNSRKALLSRKKFNSSGFLYKPRASTSFNLKSSLQQRVPLKFSSSGLATVQTQKVILEAKSRHLLRATVFVHSWWATFASLPQTFWKVSIWLFFVRDYWPFYYFIHVLEHIYAPVVSFKLINSHWKYAYVTNFS